MRICKIDGCDNRSYQRGWCAKHYTRWYRHGDTATVLGRWRGQSGIIRVPLSDVTPDKRAMAWAAQQRFDTALQALHDKHRNPDSLKGYRHPSREARSLSTLSEKAIR